MSADDRLWPENCNRAEDGSKPTIEPNKQEAIGIAELWSLRSSCAAECGQQLPPSDGDCHTPLPGEVRKGNDTTPRVCSLAVQGGQDAGCFHLAGRFGLDPLRNRSDGQSFICLGAGTFEEEPRHELRHDAGWCACRVLFGCGSGPGRLF